MSKLSHAASAILLWNSGLWGQSRATITGTVTDQSGSPIPNVHIRATATATGTKSETVSSDTGKYTMPFLAPGNYTLAASVQGFKQFEQKGVTLDAGAQPVIDIKMDIGAVTENITVSAEAPLISASNASVGAHEGPNGHPHQMEADPSNEWVLGPDAGQDRIYVWKLTVGGSSPLIPAATPFVTTPPGGGPRHFAFHPNGRWVYSIQEEGNTIIFWRFDRATGSLTNMQQVSSLPPGFVGTVFTSEIRVSADGRFVYGVNRLSDTICIFRIHEDGTLSQVSHASTLGDYPRIIAIDPSGRFLLSGNQRADNVTTFRISGRRGDEHEDDDLSLESDNVYGESKGSGDFKPKRGSLTFTGDYTAVGSPSGMVFLI